MTLTINTINIVMPEAFKPAKDYLLTEKITNTFLDWKRLAKFLIDKIDYNQVEFKLNLEIEKIREVVIQEENITQDIDVRMYLDLQFIYIYIKFLTGKNFWENGLCPLGSYQHLSEIDSYLKLSNLKDNVETRYLIAYSMMLSKLINSGYWNLPSVLEKYFKENKVII